MIKNLIKERKLYTFINRYLPVLNNFQDENIHNKHLIKFNNPSENTFEGKNLCGATSFLLYHYLKNNVEDKNFCFTIKFMYSSIGYGKYLEDHVYLLVNDKYILDPTYRQFLTNVEYEKKYFNLIFKYYPYIYYGKDIKCFYKKLQKINSQLPDENLLFWHNSVDVTDQYLSKDLDKILIDSELKYELIKILNQKSFF